MHLFLFLFYFSLLYILFSLQNIFKNSNILIMHQFSILCLIFIIFFVQIVFLENGSWSTETSNKTTSNQIGFVFLLVFRILQNLKLTAFLRHASLFEFFKPISYFVFVSSYPEMTHIQEGLGPLQYLHGLKCLAQFGKVSQ